MKKYVIDRIQSCIVYQAYNVSRQKRLSFLQPITSRDSPNQLIGIDFCDPSTATPQDNKYVLSLTDYFIKLLAAISLQVCST